MASNEKPGFTLLRIARASIANALGREYAADETALWIQEPGACFVTLTQRGALRGCIGSLEARRPLITDVKANAVAAAFHDPRFTPLRIQDLEHIDIEVSVLSPMESMTFSSEADALAQLRPGVDGVVFEFERYRSTFLPQVWEQFADSREFLEQLKRKAGLPPGFWAPAVKLHRYTVSRWKEADLRRQRETPDTRHQAN